MTRFLSEALKAKEPYFRQGITQLEAASANPCHDIRLTHEIRIQTIQKMKELGLDPDDTTAHEFYEALKAKARADDKKLEEFVRHMAIETVSMEGDPLAGIVETIKELPGSKRCFSIKSAKLRQIIKKAPPKKAMKALGYRSLESCLKHEQPSMIIAAGWIKEPKAWRTKILDQYKSLQAADFEDRKVSIIYPNNFKWRSLGQELVEATNSHILSIKELGQIIIVPSESTLPDGVVTATFSLCIEQINEIIASSSYLKFNQTKKKFGPSVLEVIGDRPLLESTLLDAPVSWFLIQKYYSRAADGFREDIFEPYIHFEDMVWHNVEDILADLVPSFEFWKNTTYLGYQHQSKLVSLNLIDNAINLCNNLHLNYRLDNHFRKSLWHELQTRYMKHEPIEQSILAELQPSLAMEVATI